MSSLEEMIAKDVDKILMGMAERVDKAAESSSINETVLKGLKAYCADNDLSYHEDFFVLDKSPDAKVARIVAGFDVILRDLNQTIRKTEIATTPEEYVAKPWEHESPAEKSSRMDDLTKALQLPVGKIDLLIPERSFPGEIISVRNDIACFKPYKVKESDDKFPVYGIAMSAANGLQDKKVGDLLLVNMHQRTEPNQLPEQTISVTDVPLVTGFDEEANNLLAQLSPSDHKKLSMMIHQENPAVRQIRLNEWKTKRRLDEAPFLGTENEGAVMKPHPDDGRGSKEIPKFYLLSKVQVEQHKQLLLTAPMVNHGAKKGRS